MKDIVFILVAALVAIIATGATYFFLDARRSSLRHLKLVIGNNRSIETFMRFILKQLLHDKSFRIEVGVSQSQAEELLQSGYIILPFNEENHTNSIEKGIKLVIDPYNNPEFIRINSKGLYQMEGFYKVISVKGTDAGWLEIRLWY